MASLSVNQTHKPPAKNPIPTRFNYRKKNMHSVPKSIYATAAAIGLLAALALQSPANAATKGTKKSKTTKPKATKPISIERYTGLTIICGKQEHAKGRGAIPNEVIRVRIQEQIAGGIDLSDELVADKNGEFIMNDFCDPLSPNAEVAALWSFVGQTSKRTGKNMVSYKLAPGATLAPPTTKPAGTTTTAT
jgi:hypothetical protein